MVGKTSQEGLTLIPLEVYIKKGYAKVLVGLAKGKKNYDKRESLKEKERNRDIERNLKAR